MKSRSAMFVVQVVWLLFLGAMAAVFLTQREVIALPDAAGSLPIGVIWFGALGAVLISLTGIVEHADDWKESYVLWHLSRPLMGASLAVVAVLIMQAGILAVGSAPAAGQAAVPKNILYYLVAFLVGYREETFRELIKRLVDLIFSPATTPKPAAATAGANTPVTVGGATDATKLPVAKQPPVEASTETKTPPAKPELKLPENSAVVK